MKKIILSLAIAMSSYCSYAQNVFPTPTGNVGIGTTSPNVPLHVSRYGNNVTGNLTLLTTFTDPTGIKGVSLGYNQSSQAGIISRL